MPSETLADELLQLSRSLRRLTHPVRRGEITPEQYWLLRRLRIAGPLSVGELAAQLGISQSSATTACKRLERLGLVVRARCRDDERVVRVSLTDAAHHRIDRWMERRRQAVRGVLGCLDDEEQARFGQLVTRVLACAAQRLAAEGSEQRAQDIDGV